MAAGFALLASTLVLAFAAGRWVPSSAALPIALISGATALAALLCVLLFQRSRLSGDLPSIRLAVGMAAFAVCMVGTDGLLPALAPDAYGTLAAALRPAGIAVVLLQLTLAVTGPEVRSAQRLSRTLLGALGVLIGAWAVLGVLDVVAEPLRSLVGMPEQTALLLPPGLVGLAWAVLATVYMWRGIRERRHVFAWFGLMLAALTFAEFAHAGAANGNVGMRMAEGTLLLVATTFGVVGALREVHLAFASQSTQLLRAEVDKLQRQARLEAEMAAQAERAHEARNALTAIEGATLTLERSRDRLDADQRARLAAAVTGEIARLQELVSAERAQTSVQDFDVADVIGRQVALLEARGAPTSIEAQPGLRAQGRPADTEQALQNLLVNADRHAPGTPVSILARREGDQILVHVDDRGPGVAPAMRDRIFRRGERASAATRGLGLGLYVARELMRAQGGDVRIDDRPGPGSRFTLVLPAALDRSAGLREIARDAGEQSGELVHAAELDGTTDVTAYDGPASTFGGAGRHLDDDRSGMARRTAVGGERDVERS